MKNHYYKEHRKQVRAKMHNTVVGILNSNKTVTIGTIIDISLGGAKCANYEIRMEPDNRKSFDSIDLIAGSHSILGLPCKPIWESEGESEGNSKMTIKRLYGIRFCELTPKQIFLLKKFIDICVSEGLINSTSRTPITVEEE
jgi:hypothetical protein